MLLIKSPIRNKKRAGVKMKQIFLILLIWMSLVTSPARADLWGADLPLLAEIVANTLQQIYEIRQVINNGKNQVDLIREINRGINDSLRMMETITGNVDPGIYRDWSQAQNALKGILEIYGKAPKSPSERVQTDADQGVAEAIALNNSIFEYTKRIDLVGEQIKNFSHQVSPGGAAKLTAEGVGVMLHVMNEGLRAQATGLKLQAQSMALGNKKEKDQTRSFLEQSRQLSSEMKNLDTSFGVPKF